MLKSYNNKLIMTILLYITANQKMEHENKVTSYVYETSLY